MRSEKSVFHATYLRAAGAVAFIAIVNPNGDEGIGSAFHIGEGIFETARHVIDSVIIKEAATTKSAHLSKEASGKGTAAASPLNNSRGAPYSVRPRTQKTTQTPNQDAVNPPRNYRQVAPDDNPACVPFAAPCKGFAIFVLHVCNDGLNVAFIAARIQENAS
jgi:hypothetical protein